MKVGKVTASAQLFGALLFWNNRYWGKKGQGLLAASARAPLHPRFQTVRGIVFLFTLYARIINRQACQRIIRLAYRLVGHIGGQDQGEDGDQ